MIKSSTSLQFPVHLFVNSLSRATAAMRLTELDGESRICEALDCWDYWTRITFLVHVPNHISASYRCC